MEPILSMKNISKSFMGVKALDNVSIDFYPGEVHAIMGENGAGKSTLMKVLFGIYQRDEGDITYKGVPVRFKHSVEALRQGIAMVHQELSAIPDRSVAENIFLGREPQKKGIGLIDLKKMNADTLKVFKKMDIEGINPRTKIRDLDIAKMQLMDIAKAVSVNSDVLILDEATSSLTEPEARRLFRIIEDFKKNGTAVLYITHKMDEVFRISDKVTVLRDGELVKTAKTIEMTQNDLITMMVGREMKDIYPKTESKVGDVVLEIKNFTRQKENDCNSFSLRKGEILGMAGLVGAGRSEIVESIFGMRTDYQGELYIKGKRVVIKNPADSIANGLALIPEDRKISGLNLKGSVNDNASIIALKYFCKAGFINKKLERKEVDKQVKALSIKTPSLHQIVSYLSGGNQQKVVLAKWLLMNSDVIIMDEPTRGIDVGAKREIYMLMNELKAEGKGIIMISSELPEVLGMCDRLLVMYKGKIVGELKDEEMTQENILIKAVGAGEV
ncbi:MAG: sugar ABC transporter ATP-binding protein [Christensenellaceae bacterium]